MPFFTSLFPVFPAIFRFYCLHKLACYLIIVLYVFTSFRSWSVIAQMSIFLGVLGFVLYFIYDINSICWNNRLLQKLFLMGTILVVVSTGYTFYLQREFLYSGSRLIIWGIATAVFFFLLIYTLFFALPFDATYVNENTEREAYTQGIYGLCRHPGVLWFSAFYICLSLMIDSSRFRFLATALIILNILYVVFQDIWTFPRSFSNYGEYQKNTPFLLPTIHSIKYCMQTLRLKEKGGVSNESK